MAVVRVKLSDGIEIQGSYSVDKGLITVRGPNGASETTHVDPRTTDIESLAEAMLLGLSKPKR